MTDRIISLDAAIEAVRNFPHGVKLRGQEVVEALSALLAVGGWIKTANTMPEDGQVVIVWHESRIQPETAYRCIAGERYCWFLYNVSDPIRWEPSYWQHLPAPPEIE